MYSTPHLRSRHILATLALALWWSAHVAPHGVSLLLLASVPVSSRCTLLKLHLALSLLVVACTFPNLTSHCRLTCIVCLVHSLPLSVMVNASSPHPPSTVTQVLLSTVNFVMGDCEELKIVTFNTNGLGEFKQRKDGFDFLRKQSANIFLLRETHWKTGAENVIRSQWDSQTVQVKE